MLFQIDCVCKAIRKADYELCLWIDLSILSHIEKTSSLELKNMNDKVIHYNPKRSYLQLNWKLMLALK